MASTAKKSLALDPLENNIDVERTYRTAALDASVGREGDMRSR
jgi:hypothetical protein